MSTEIKNDRKYTKDHEWAKQDGTDVTVGITAYAVDQLGDITLVNIDVKEGDPITAGKAFGTVESVKTLADLFAPVSGTVTRVNSALVDNPETVNDDCYGKGWLIAVRASGELDTLLDHAAYAKLLAESSH